MAGYSAREKKRRTKLWIALILLTVGTLALSTWLAGPSPPKRIRLATGDPAGYYAYYGKKYQEHLHGMGLEVELVNTNGSVDNLQRLARGEVDVAFMQGGIYSPEANPDGDLRGLAALYLEPLWVFYRGKDSIRSLSSFEGKTISVGPTNSGTEAVGKLLLKEHDLSATNTKLVNLSMAEASRQLREGGVDVAFIVTSYRDEVVHDLLKRDDIQLMNFRQDVAYSRTFPYLTPVKLAEGLLDLHHNIPPEEKVVLAPAAQLVCREDLHPRVVEQILKTAKTVHEKGSLIDAPNRFPSLEGVDLPLHETAETYMRSGESFLSRLLPYWGMRWVFQLKILILPLLAIWFPFLKVLPMVYRYRANRLLRQHYEVLRDVENSLEQAADPDELRKRLQGLENLRTEMESVSRKVPANMQSDVYHWRLHVSLVRTEALDRLRRLEVAQGREFPGVGM